MRRLHRYLPRVRLRTLLAGVTLLCALLGLRSSQIARERRVLHRLRSAAEDTDAFYAGVHPWYEYRRHYDFLKWTRRWSTGRIWHPADAIAQLVYYRVVGVDIFGDGIRDCALADLRALPRLESLTIKDAPRVTDACIPTLVAMEGLRLLRLSGTAVTKQGAATLQQALDGCQVNWDPPRPAPAIDDRVSIGHSAYQGRRVVAMRGSTIDDDALASVTSWDTIVSLTLTEAPRVTDDSLTYIAGAEGLKKLLLHGTSVTVDGAAKLQKALPDCEIQRLPPGPYRRRPRTVPWWWRVVLSFDPASE